jgi:hypothetical protein
MQLRHRNYTNNTIYTEIANNLYGQLQTRHEHYYIQTKDTPRNVNKVSANLAIYL